MRKQRKNKWVPGTPNLEVNLLAASIFPSLDHQGDHHNTLNEFTVWPSLATHPQSASECQSDPELEEGPGLIWSPCLQEVSLISHLQERDPILWPPDAKNWFICKDPDAGKDRKQEAKGTTEDEMVGWHYRLEDEFEQVWASSGSWCWTGKPGVLQSMGSQRVAHDWATELNRSNSFSFVCFSMFLPPEIPFLCFYL